MAHRFKHYSQKTQESIGQRSPLANNKRQMPTKAINGEVES